jgi:hypothetical protein
LLFCIYNNVSGAKNSIQGLPIRLYPFQPNKAKLYFHPEKYTIQSIENYNTFDADGKDKTMWTG